MYIVQKEHQNFFSNKINLVPKKEIEYKFAKNGMYYKLIDNGGSSVVVSNETKIDDSLKTELQNSEFFDTTFKTIVNHDKDFVAIYFNSYKNYNRYYPFLNNVYEVFPSDITMTDYNFYYLANEINNPEKKVIWTDIYLDPAKKGWLISAIAPIYDNNNKLQGVTGLDITLNNFLNSFLDLDLPYDGQTLVINENKEIILMQEGLNKIFDSNFIKTYNYKIDEKVSQTIIKKENIDINSEGFNEFKVFLSNLGKNKNYSSQIKIKDKEYIVFSEKIEKAPWHVISFLQKDKITSNVNTLEKDYKMIGISMILLIIVFYLGFFVFLSKKAKEFVLMIEKPLKEIITLSNKILETNKIKRFKPTGIIDLDILINNFNKLVISLNYKTKKLIEEESKRIFNEKLANTDVLTGCFNRRYLIDFSIEYLKIVKRKKLSMSIMMLDLDDFKYINDTFGHSTGDKVLIDFVKLIKQNIRENDLIVRLGGDEFLVLLPNTNINDAKIVAQKILSNLSKENIKSEFKVNTSIGIAKYEGDTTINTIISRADNALYQAKSSGKNCIV